jgi:hypothetical protein
MEKQISFQSITDKGVFLYTIGEGRDHGYLTKTAGASFHPEIAKYIDQAKPIPGRTQLLVTALGAGEFYGANINSDFFPEEALKHYGDDYGYKTFEKHAKIYKHHVNKDPLKSYGDVVLSVWNEKMKRVELIIIVDNAKAPDIVERVDNGDPIEVSMGCRVKFDVCSICGNHAKTRAQYCDHLRYHLGKIPPGFTKKAVAINTLPVFFDISFVLIGADRIAKVMKKVASVGSANHIEKVAYGLDRAKIAAKKTATIIKEIPSNTSPNTVKNIERIGEQANEVLRPLEKELPRQTIIRITSVNRAGPDNLNRLLSTLAMLGIAPKPAEFQSMALRSLGKPDVAEHCERTGIVFDPSMFVPESQQKHLDDAIQLTPGNFDGSIFELLKPYMEDRSYSRPLLQKRVIKIIKLAESGQLTYPVNEHVKSAEDREPIGLLPMMLTLAGLYAALGKKLPESAVDGIDKVVGMHPGLSAALGIGAVAGMSQLFRRSITGKFDQNPDKEPYRELSWQEDLARKNSNPITKSAGVASRVFLGVPAIYMASGMQTVRKARNPNEKEGWVGSFIRKYPDVASGLLVGEALAGRPLSGKIGKLFNGGSSLIKKTASLSDDARSTVVFSLAFPGVSPVLRGASAAVDQALLSGVEKLVQHKKTGTHREDK